MHERPIAELRRLPEENADSGPVGDRVWVDGVGRDRGPDGV